MTNLKTEYENSKALFAARILSVTSIGDAKTFTFKVEKHCKNAATKLTENFGIEMFSN